MRKAFDVVQYLVQCSYKLGYLAKPMHNILLCIRSDDGKSGEHLRLLKEENAIRRQTLHQYGTQKNKCDKSKNDLLDKGSHENICAKLHKLCCYSEQVTGWCASISKNHKTPQDREEHTLWNHWTKHQTYNMCPPKGITQSMPWYVPLIASMILQYVIQNALYFTIVKRL